MASLLGWFGEDFNYEIVFPAPSCSEGQLVPPFGSRPICEFDHCVLVTTMLNVLLGLRLQRPQPCFFISAPAIFNVFIGLMLAENCG